MAIDRKQNFIDKSNKVHNNFYDYSKIEYVNSTTKVCIICPIHGEFWQTPQAHARGNKCPKCANIKRGDAFRSNGDDFIKRAIEIHGDQYDYSKVEYRNSNEKVCIICKEHGEFWMTPMNHLLGQGCPKCSGRGLNTEEIIEMFKKKHGDKYDYSKVEYVRMHDKVCIICPTHGEFWQTPSKHLLGQGCPKCGIDKRSLEKNIGQDEFIIRCKEIYGDRYDYSQTIYTKMENKVNIICPKHGEFWQKPYDHLHGHGCPKCGLIESRSENEIYEYLCKYLGKENVEHSNRSILNGYEIDIYIPNLKIGIEYNGLKWHSEKFRGSQYHLMKLTMANEKGVKLIQIFEDEYINHKEIVLSKLRRLLYIDSNIPSVMGRKCVVKEIDKDTSKSFINTNHIQGYKGGTLSLGCYTKNTDKLIGVMVFIKTDKEWILNRFATDNSFICKGVGGKLFSYFVKNYDPQTVISFADLRWTINKDNNLYTKIGFSIDSILKPNYQYVNSCHPSERIHKFNFRKDILEKRYNIDKSKTEDELTQELGYYKIWDCGLIKYKWRKTL